METETAATASTSQPSVYNPATRPAQIDSLISGVDRYNPHNLPLLHDYLDGQLKDEYDWDCMAALAIFKLYQFNPTTFSYPTATLMLAKSLHALPSPHFNLCLGLLGEAPVSILPPSTTEDGAEQTANTDSANAASTAAANADGAAQASTTAASQPSAGILTDATIVKLSQLASLLSSSRYPTFWTTLRSEEYSDLQEDVLGRLGNFENGVRKVVLNGTASAFRTISRKRLAGYLGLEDGSDLDAFLKEYAEGWNVRSDGIVEIPANKDNQVTQVAGGVVREDVGLGELNKLLQQAAPSVPAPSAIKA